MKQILIHFLSNFKELTESQVRELAEAMTVIEVKKNDRIIKEGKF